jgi:hypothetical protein
MSKKKTGHLSGAMIVRRRPREGAGFVLGETSREASASSQTNTSSQASTVSEAATSSGKVVAERTAAQVVPLYPGSTGKASDGDKVTRSGGGAALVRADRLVDALRSADIAEAEEVFATMTGLGQVEVLRLLYGPDGRDLALVCRAMGLEQLQFVSVYILARKLGLGEEALDARELARIVAYFDALDETEAESALAAWRAGGRGSVGKPHSPV